MHQTLLANTWIVAHLPGTKYTGVLCCAGSAGEAAFRNSLDGLFAEAGYQHLPATLNRNRPPTYYVVGSVAADQAGEKRVPTPTSDAKDADDVKVTTVCNIPTRRIVRHQHISMKQLPKAQKFQFAQVFTNASTLALRLVAVELDLSAMDSLVRLPDYFLLFDTSLTSVKLPPNLEQIGRGSLAECTRLTAIDMSTLVKVSALPDAFMRGRTSLTSVKLPPNLEQIGRGSLAECTSLTPIDMSTLVKVSALPDEFMRGCSRLTSVKLPPNVKDIGWACLSNCTRLTVIDLSAILLVTTLPAQFMRGCSSLTSVMLPPNLEGIGRAFLVDCTSLTAIDMSPLVKVTMVAGEFMQGCTSLTSVKLPPKLDRAPLWLYLSVTWRSLWR